LKGFAAVAILLLLVSAGVSGIRILTEYPRFLLFDATYQKVAGFEPQYMPNLRGLLYLLVDRKVPPSVFGVLLAAVSVLTLWWAARNWRDEQFDVSFAAAVVATILTSYHLYNYDLTLVLLPIAIVCGELARQGRLVTNRLLTGVLAVIFLPPVHLALAEHGIYALMGIPVLVLFFVVIRVIHFTAPQKSTNVIVATQ
ncbi:MAG TPA: hypothetical protein VJV74_13460, partial [Terriglobia bacterium]|nr:hypothetical protein [Terriglobia bacterium]